MSYVDDRRRQRISQLKSLVNLHKNKGKDWVTQELAKLSDIPGGKLTKKEVAEILFQE